MARMAQRVGQNKHVPEADPYKVDWTIALQLLDTSWRVAVPILALTFIGHKLDLGLRTNPLFIIIGLFVAISISIILVYRQVKIAYPDFFKKAGGK